MSAKCNLMSSRRASGRLIGRFPASDFGVAVHRPDADPAEAAQFHERGLLGHRLGVIERPERVAVEQPRRPGNAVPVPGVAVVLHILDVPVVVSGRRGAGRRVLEQSVVGVGDAGPSATVEGDSKQQPTRVDAAVDEVADVEIGAACGHCRIGGVQEQRRLVVGLQRSFPGTVQVVRHHHRPVQIVEDRRKFVAPVNAIGTAGERRSEQVVPAGLLAVEVELAAELRQQQGEVLPVLGESGVRAASEKYRDRDPPPMEMEVRSPYLALSFLIWLKVPAKGWLGWSATPSRLRAAS